ncbi:Stk1 family PASTA domain-containing Ser/Thr kinase [Paenibacillus aurantius]|uniref:Serine/threonine-protein kinase PrkC n=1 Tax=Paenibacillus aurantius TaxID=2918900 RepID=A0AA96LI09_9BACL|nr:Stk1 family PASTA domain-containing Ser/Thr kinase [Paenibacillus aurantius]WNQ13673.1 Stk1 family PASTA domain-containing Ser/Thr kinase [Paenibacillus aurantius]
MIGQVLGGRYEILDRIGGGGMALVYKARDILLNRKVAVKVLRSQFVHDEEFIHRFRREAQSAAALSHPNVVSIYDVGQKDETHYIVMEYVEGQTLNDLIKEKAPLQVEEAIHIASQICDALEHAHSNQIVHRDIKPHNILLGRNGRVKVTDFGIARAGTSSSITQTGSVLGSVHYFSPEHAKGTTAGAKSDLYSLGIVLYQMLTGKLPFSGDSPVSVALKHLQEDVEEPRKVNPLIPQSVENIILKAMRKNPENRYQSAHEMLMDLETCLKPERRNEPKLAFDDDEDDEERTRVVPAIRPDRDKGEAAASVPRAVEKKKRRWVKPTVWTAVLLVLIIGLWVTAKAMQGSIFIQDVAIPNVEKKPLAEAQNELAKAELKSEVHEEFDPGVEKGYVIRQMPSGMKVKPGYTVKLFVSKGVEMQTMSGYIGKSFNEAHDALINSGLKEEQIARTDEFSDQPEGTVIKQSPNPNDPYDPTKVSIALTVSKGKESASMPDLIGQTLTQATARLTAAKLKVAQENIIYKPSFQQPKGKIYDQFPYKPGDSVDQGAKDIVLYVSTGMPENAGEYVFSVPASPAAEGKPSIVRIVVSDAKADNAEFATKSISKQEIFNIPIIVTADKPATIQIFRDNALIDTKTFTYKDYTDAQTRPSSTPTPSPSGSPAPSGSPGVSPGASGKSPSPSPSGGR